MLIFSFTFVIETCSVATSARVYAHFHKHDDQDRCQEDHYEEVDHEEDDEYGGEIDEADDDENDNTCVLSKVS